MAFLVAHSQPKLNWNLALNVCSLKCVDHNTKRLHKFIRFIDLDIRQMRFFLQKKKHFSLFNRLRILLQKFVYIIFKFFKSYFLDVLFNGVLQKIYKKS